MNAVETPEAPPAAPPKEQESAEELERRARKPPAEGPCKRCGNERPLNRLMLCYRCWVITNIEDAAKAQGQAWAPGMPHPAWCQCALPEHSGRPQG